ADPSAPLTIVALLDPATQAPGHWTQATRQPAPSTQPSASSASDVFSPSAPAASQPAGPGPADPLLSAQTLMAGPSGAGQGRNWTGKAVSRVRAGRVRVIETRPDVLAKIASEEDAPWPDSAYVVAADG
ncbi:hypothetical protein RB628_41615, partial [Streptomyces sp. ADMS]|nr:hypothetical protein [Streptomyces sp. ADMS]